AHKQAHPIVDRFCAHPRRAHRDRTAWLTMQSVRTSLRTKFPANKEINREFCKFGASAAISASNQRANSKACSKIAYATEQGIFAAITGNFFAITGNLIERAAKALSCCRTSN